MNLVRNSRRDVSPLSHASTSADSPALNSRRSHSSVIRFLPQCSPAIWSAGRAIVAWVKPRPGDVGVSCGVRGSADTWKYHRQSPFPAGGGAPDGALFNFVLDRVSKTQVIARGEMFIERDLIFVDLVEDETSLLLWIEEL